MMTRRPHRGTNHRPDHQQRASDHDTRKARKELRAPTFVIIGLLSAVGVLLAGVGALFAYRASPAQAKQFETTQQADALVVVGILLNPHIAATTPPSRGVGDFKDLYPLEFSLFNYGAVPVTITKASVALASSGACQVRGIFLKNKIRHVAPADLRQATVSIAPGQGGVVATEYAIHVPGLIDTMAALNTPGVGYVKLNSSDVDGGEEAEFYYGTGNSIDTQVASWLRSQCGRLLLGLNLFTDAGRPLKIYATTLGQLEANSFQAHGQVHVPNLIGRYLHTIDKDGRLNLFSGE